MESAPLASAAAPPPPPSAAKAPGAPANKLAPLGERSLNAQPVTSTTLAKKVELAAAPAPRCAAWRPRRWLRTCACVLTAARLRRRLHSRRRRTPRAAARAPQRGAV